MVNSNLFLSASPHGGTYPGQVKQSFGGVGRNVADCLARLGCNPLFLSAIGKDMYADTLLHQFSHMVGGIHGVLKF